MHLDGTSAAEERKIVILLAAIETHAEEKYWLTPSGF
jgi:hypothetical protein